MPSPLDLANVHYEHGKALQASAAGTLLGLWRGVDRRSILASWSEMLPEAVAVVTASQLDAATDGSAYMSVALAAQSLDTYGPPVAPQAFAGIAYPLGETAEVFDLSATFMAPAFTALTGIRGGLTLDRAMGGGLNDLMLRTQMQISDAARSAGSVAMATRSKPAGYVRMLNPPSCSRCALLAGKWFRWNAGFLRHPGCDCRHIPSAEAMADDMTTDPFEYFRSLPPPEQDRIFTKAGAEAIRDGSDIYQVVNARRGMSYAGTSADGSKRGQKAAGSFTSAGTTRRGNFRTNTEAGARTKGKRLTPDAIYALNGSDRAAALRDLERYGYILPAGQAPRGSIRGDVEGFGALGRGGEIVGARRAVADARLSGSRSPTSRYTMTEAERRVFDSKLSLDAAKAGRNPFGKGPIQSGQLELAQKNHDRWLASSGQIFTK
ncbi:hypothetical protein [Arthrobacter sp. UYCu712]|uniref:hypothetical protein n=1 Tax=Arthrobacter sp. UYCu712 TaxID=3156340 RepID=UPI0033982019